MNSEVNAEVRADLAYVFFPSHIHHVALTSDPHVLISDAEPRYYLTDSFG